MTTDSPTAELMKDKELLEAFDSMRLVDHASGWFDQGGGDYTSRHIYSLALKPTMPQG
jgi:hypothetical protein